MQVAQARAQLEKEDAKTDVFLNVISKVRVTRGIPKEGLFAGICGCILGLAGYIIGTYVPPLNPALLMASGTALGVLVGAYLHRSRSMEMLEDETGRLEFFVHSVHNLVNIGSDTPSTYKAALWKKAEGMVTDSLDAIGRKVLRMSNTNRHEKSAAARDGGGEGEQ